MKRVLSFGLCLLLSACAGSTDSQPLPSVSGGKSGVISVSRLSLDQPTRPSALIGIFAASRLAMQPGMMAAGAVQAVRLLQELSPVQGPQDGTNMAVATLEQLGTLLSADVWDVLNRSTDRSQALDDYLASLRTVMEQATSDQASVAADLEVLESELDTVQDDVHSADRAQKAAEKAEDYGQSAAYKQTLSELKGKQAALTETIANRKDVLDDLKKLLAKAEERTLAVENNRSALITGIRLEETPGLDDLDLITGRKKRTGSPGTVFGF